MTLIRRAQQLLLLTALLTLCSAESLTSSEDGSSGDHISFIDFLRQLNDNLVAEKPTSRSSVRLADVAEDADVKQSRTNDANVVASDPNNGVIFNNVGGSEPKVDAGDQTINDNSKVNDENDKLSKFYNDYRNPLYSPFTGYRPATFYRPSTTFVSPPTTSESPATTSRVPTTTPHNTGGGLFGNITLPANGTLSLQEFLQAILSGSLRNITGTITPDLIAFLSGNLSAIVDFPKLLAFLRYIGISLTPILQNIIGIIGSLASGSLAANGTGCTGGGLAAGSSLFQLLASLIRSLPGINIPINIITGGSTLVCPAPCTPCII